MIIHLYLSEKDVQALFIMMDAAVKGIGINAVHDASRLVHMLNEALTLARAKSEAMTTTPGPNHSNGAEPDSAVT